MLDLLLKTDIPLIAVRTTDVTHCDSTLEHYAKPLDIVIIDRTASDETRLTTDKLIKRRKGSITVLKRVGKLDIEELYESALENGNKFILLNAPIHPLILDAGTLETPREILIDVVSRITQIGHKHYDMVADHLSGLNSHQAMNVLMFARALENGITPANITKARSIIVGQGKGIAAVPTDSIFYKPNQQVNNWIYDNVKYFPTAFDRRLVPRGVLFDGDNGTGKTESAKYIAREFGLPLYRVDVPDLLDKYQGEAESSLRSMLYQIEREAPCIILLDEIEKIFAGNDDTGTISRILSKLLWWLQEHDRPIITVMTCNNIKALPRELYRPGRINNVITFEGLIKTAGERFVKDLIKTFDIDVKYHVKLTTPVIESAYKNDDDKATQAELTGLVIQEVKRLGAD